MGQSNYVVKVDGPNAAVAVFANSESQAIDNAFPQMGRNTTTTVVAYVKNFPNGVPNNEVTNAANRVGCPQSYVTVRWD